MYIHIYIYIYIYLLLPLLIPFKVMKRYVLRSDVTSFSPASLALQAPNGVVTIYIYIYIYIYTHIYMFIGSSARVRAPDPTASRRPTKFCRSQCESRAYLLSSGTTAKGTGLG